MSAANQHYIEGHTKTIQALVSRISRLEAEVKQLTFVNQQLTGTYTRLFTENEQLLTERWNLSEHNRVLKEALTRVRGDKINAQCQAAQAFVDVAVRKSTPATAQVTLGNVQWAVKVYVPGEQAKVAQRAVKLTSQIGDPMVTAMLKKARCPRYMYDLAKWLVTGAKGPQPTKG